MTLDNLFDESTVRFIMLIIFSAFLLFFVIYAFFAAFHALRYGFKGDKFTIPVLIIFVAGSGVLIFFTLASLGIL
jgi:fumarate reductase subunit D